MLDSSEESRQIYFGLYFYLGKMTAAYIFTFSIIFKILGELKKEWLKYKLGNRGKRVRYPEEEQLTTSFHNIQTVSEFLPTTYPMGFESSHNEGRNIVKNGK
jgi:hypothetical protein